MKIQAQTCFPRSAVRSWSGKAKIRAADLGKQVCATLASVALRWFLENPLPAYAGRVKQLILGGNRVVVPALWHLEVANGWGLPNGVGFSPAPTLTGL